MFQEYWNQKEGGILAIPTSVENEIRQVLIQRDREGHGRNDGGGNFQILERVVCVSKEHMVTLSEDGMKKLYQGLDQADGQLGEGKWRVFVANIWGCLMGQITERERVIECVCELGTMFNDDVQMGLDTVCVKRTGQT